MQSPTTSHLPCSIRHPALACFLCLALSGLLPASRALATTRTVNTLADDQSNGCTTAAGGCTLREAIAASAAGDAIVFAASLGGGAILLNGNELAVSKDLTITGPGGGVTVSADGPGLPIGFGDSRVFNISAGTVRLSNLTIAYGAAGGDNGIPTGSAGGDGEGGGIRNNGVLTLTNCTLSNNLVVGGPGAAGQPSGQGEGAGIYNTASGDLTLQGCTLANNRVSGGAGGDGSQGGSGRGGAIANRGTLRVVSCTLSDNSASGGTGGRGVSSSGTGGNGAGGGIYNAASLTMINTTLSGNSANGGDGGEGVGVSGGDAGNGEGGGIYNAASLTMTNATLSGNTASGGNGGASGVGNGDDGNGEAGGLLANGQGSGTASLRNALIAGNLASAPAGGLASGPDVSGAVSSQGHNLIGNTAGSSGWVASDKTNANAAPLNLGPLQNNGGLTPTMALLPGSAALNAGDNAVLTSPFNLSTDQRGSGYPRRQGTAVDIGAYEADVPTAGTTLVVNTTAERSDGVCGATDCTLLEAVSAANANADASTINFKTGLTGTIKNTLVPGGLNLLNPVTINGPGARVLTLSGNNTSRLFAIASGNSATISGLTIANGNSASASTTSGGGIFNEGTLTLQDCAIINNSGGSGGAVASQGALTVTRCTFAGNQSTGHGGAIRIASNTISATATITSSTFTNNTAASSGAITPSGTAALPCTMTVTSCTISGNSATDSNGIGGGIFNFHDATITVGNTIIAGNSAPTGVADVSGLFNSQGYNLIGKSDGSGGFEGPGDQTGTGGAPLDPRLGAIANNGGPTDTLALLAGSPALDKGKSFGLTTDQRGLARPFDDTATLPASGGDNSDIGACERQPPKIFINDQRALLEGNPGSAGFTQFNVTLSFPYDEMVMVGFQTANGTATAGSDYVAKSGTLTFNPGDTSETVRVNFVGDTVAELNETLFLQLNTPVGASIGDSRGSAYIKNDDGPGISIANAVAVFEGDSGTTPQSFTVTLSAASSNTVTVDWATANNTAGPADFTAASGTLTFNPGQTSKTITVQVKGDTAVEPTETYRVKLNNPKFAVLLDSTGVGYIKNDDGGASVADEPSE